MKKRYYLLFLFIVFLYALSNLMAKPIAEKLYQADGTFLSEMNPSGDPEEQDWYNWSDGDPLDPIDNTSYIYLTELALSYNGKIPFSDQGRFWKKDFPVLTDGYNVANFNGSYIGVDSLGYVQWLFRNIFGYYDTRLENLSAHYEDIKVPFEEIRVGDVGMLHLTPDKNHYGVCIGYLDDMPVFSHCDSVPQEFLPNGGTRLSFLQLSTERYINGSGPINFQYFIRPTHEWEDLDVQID